MSRQTLVRVRFPHPEEAGAEVEQHWSVLTHRRGEEYWSEILDAHRHPHVLHDAYGFEDVVQCFGDSPEESRLEAIRTLERLVREKGGRVEDVGAMEGG